MMKGNEMSCDEFYHRHFHKKITHKHPHSDDTHHHHPHSGEPNGHHSPSTPSTEDAHHLHEHTHEPAEHEHSVAHDLLHPCGEVAGISKEGRKMQGMNDPETIKTEEK